MTDTGLLWKVTGPDGASCSGGHGVWPAPPAWREAADGLFLATTGQLHHWVRRGSHLWIAEAGAPVEDLGTKVVTTRARLVEHLGVWRGHRTIRDWAGAWAAHLLMQHPDRPDAIHAAELAARCHHGLASTTEFIARMHHLDPGLGCGAPALIRALTADTDPAWLRQLTRPHRLLTRSTSTALVVTGS